MIQLAEVGALCLVSVAVACGGASSAPGRAATQTGTPHGPISPARFASVWPHLAPAASDAPACDETARDAVLLRPSESPAARLDAWTAQLASCYLDAGDPDA